MQKGPLPGGPFCCPFFAPGGGVLHIRGGNCGKPGGVSRQEKRRCKCGGREGSNPSWPTGKREGFVRRTQASSRGEADAVRRLMRWNLPTTKNRPRRFPSGTPGAVLRFKEVPPRSSATNQNLPEWQVGALPSGSRSLLPPRREVCDPPLNTSSLNLISRIISSRNKSCRAGVTPSKFLLTECRTGR